MQYSHGLPRSIESRLTTVNRVKNVQYAPGLTVNLLSVAAMTAHGLSVTFKGRVCTIRNQQNKVIGSAAQVSNKLYQLSLTKKAPSPVAAIASEPAKPSLSETGSAYFTTDSDRELRHGRSL